MTKVIEIDTDRLRLRQWRSSDREPFAAISADPVVMAYYPAPLSRPESDAMADRCEALIAERGWGFWAVAPRNTGEFIGFVGLHVPGDVLPFAPCVEVGWRLDVAYWGKGYATEAAQAALRVGFERLALSEIVSFTVVDNLRSRAVMERLGMRDSGIRFEHPAVPPGSPLRKHCLYQLKREQWQARCGCRGANGVECRDHREP